MACAIWWIRGGERNGHACTTPGYRRAVGGISHPHGTVQALDYVSLHVMRGETVGIVGESGSGKSVLAYTVMGILDPAGRITHGRILFGGLDLVTADEEALGEQRGRELSMIFQHPRTALNPIRPVGKQIGDVLWRHANILRADVKVRALELLTRSRLPTRSAATRLIPSSCPVVCVSVC